MNTQSADRELFRETIERKFLPSVIKPGRFIAGEWRRQSTLTNPKAPLLAICSPRGYEYAVNDPLTVFVAEALESKNASADRWQVGRCYASSSDTAQELKNLGVAPFVAPQLSPLSAAGSLIVPLNDLAELAGLHRLLAFSKIDISLDGRSVQSTAPRLLAVIKNLTQAKHSAAGSLLSQIFDRVVSPNEFRALCETAGTVEDLFSGRADETLASPPTFIPGTPPSPLLEAYSQRARFSFAPGGDMTNSTAEQLGISLARATEQTGLSELEVSSCSELSAYLPLAEILGSLNLALPSHVNGISLLQVAPAQVGAALGARLKRYRRARVEISLPSLSPACSEVSGLTYQSDQLVELIRSLQFAGGAQVTLDVSLGYPGAEEREVSETVETLKLLGRSIDRKLGVRVRFTRRNPAPDSVDCSLALLDTTQTEKLFCALRSQAPARGVSLSLANQRRTALEALIYRGVWKSVSEFTAFLDELDNTDSATETGSLVKYNADLRKPLTEFIRGEVERVIPKNLAPSDDIERSSIGAGVNHPAQSQHSAGFGRGKKRAGARTVAAPTKSRLRITWGKKGLARFLSHLDNMRALESALLRSGLPLSYTQGQKPRLKISYGPPLPLGFTSSCEIMDVYFDTAPPADLANILNAALPENFEISGAEVIYTKELSALETVRAAEYRITLYNTPVDLLAPAVAQALDANQLNVSRRAKSGEKTVDLRPGIYTATLADSNDHMLSLNITLALTDTFYVRPDEFLKAISRTDDEWRRTALIHRNRLLYETPSYQSSGCSSGALT